MSKVCNWFFDCSKPSLQALRKEFKEFNMNCLVQDCTPLQYIFSEYALENKLSTQFADTSLPKSDLTQILTEQFQIQCNTSVLDVFIYVVHPILAKQQTKVLQFLAGFYQQSMLNYLSRLMFYFFGDVCEFTDTADFHCGYEKYKQQFRTEFKQDLELFQYAEMLAARNPFVVSQTLASQFQRFVKLLGFDLKKEQAVDCVMNIIQVFGKMKLDFTCAQNTSCSTLLDYLTLMDDFRLQDKILLLRDSDNPAQQLARLLVIENHFAVMFSDKTPKLFYLEKAVQAIQDNISAGGQKVSLRECVGVIEQALAEDEFFLGLEQSLEAALEKVEQFTRKLFASYVRHKKLYGKELRGVLSLYRIKVAERAEKAEKAEVK